MIKLSELFDIKKNKRIVYSQVSEGKHNFVNSQTNNLGIKGKIYRLPEIFKMNPEGTITVSINGTILNAYIQPEKYYATDDVRILHPKEKMSLKEKQFYCLCISKNKYRYNYGRKAYKTLHQLEVPDISEIPDWVYKIKMPDYGKISEPFHNKNIQLDSSNWKYFEMESLFNTKLAKTITISKAKKNPGKHPLITTSAKNNGIACHTSLEPNVQGNTLSLANAGSVGNIFYQEKDYLVTDHVSIMYPKFNLNKTIAMFLIPILEKEKYRYSYGRQWCLSRMKQTEVKLPADTNGDPDWQFMEEYIKSLPYSKMLGDEKETKYKLIELRKELSEWFSRNN